MPAPKQLARAAVRRLPRREAAIRAAVLLPPEIKRRFGKVVARVLEHPPLHMGKLETNLGIPGLRVSIAADASIDCFYATPETSVGEGAAIELARALAPRCKAFIDVGANHGVYVFSVRAACDVPTHYFEPNPTLFQEIADNARRNGLRQVHGRCMALSDTVGRAEFFVDDSAPTNSSLVMWRGNGEHQVRRIEVYCTTFDAYVREHDLSELLVKVDIEGAPDALLDGAAASADRIRFLIIELIGGDVATILRDKSLGLRAYYVNGRSLEHYTGGPFRYAKREWNWLLCRETPEQLRALVPANFSVR
jgi:FkbM family methyltransferase